MAAKYTKLLRSIWMNEDFISLKSADQRLYLMLISQPDISTCGVVPLMERRWARLATDTDADSVMTALRSLAAGPRPFVMVDETTDEVWVRSYLAVDEMYRQPNGRKSIEAALSAVASPLLRTHIVRAYQTLRETLSGTHSEGDTSPQQQAASSKHRHHTPAAAAHDCAALPTSAAAAIELYVAHRLTTEHDVRKPIPYANKIRLEESETHAARLAGYDEADDPVEIVMELFGLTRRQAMAASGQSSDVPWCGPDCIECHGDAWIDVGSGLAPCPNRTAA